VEVLRLWFSIVRVRRDLLVLHIGLGENGELREDVAASGARA
jgi:hypothetical protein